MSETKKPSDKAKIFLNQARNIEERINASMLEACRLRSIAEKATSTFAAVRVSGTNQRSRVEDAVIQLDELENDIIDDITMLVEVKRDIKAVIAKLDDPADRLLLQLRYLCGKKWEEIGLYMHYTRQTLHNRHGTVLQKIVHYLT